MTRISTRCALSIVIPSHRRADLLQSCLTSLTQFAPPGTEIIVVDDGSKNAAISAVASRFDQVKIIRCNTPGGFCRAANMGIASATGEIVELLNDDTEVTEHWTEPVLQAFRDHRIAAVAPLILQLDRARKLHGQSPKIDSAGDEYDPGGFARKRRHGEVWTGVNSDQYLNTDQNGEASRRHTESLVPVFGASAAAAFYRRDLLLRAGGFPDHFGAYFDDVDLSFRLRRLGYEIVHSPESVVWHHVSGTYGAKPKCRVIELQSCNEERIFWRNTQRREWPRWLPRHAAVLAGKACRRWQEGIFIPWLIGRVRAAADISTFISSRFSRSHNDELHSTTT